MKKTIFGILLALVMSLSCVLCACAPTEPNEPDDPTPPPVIEATITGFDSISSMPTKTNYLPDEIFDKTGLIVKVKMSDNTTKSIFDTEFTDWTHKGEPLTEDVDKITFTVPNTNPAVTFDVPITVEVPAGAGISVDSSKLDDYYVLGTPIDFTSIIVVRYTIDGVTSVLDAADVTYTYGEENTAIADPTAVTFDEEGTFVVTVHYTRHFSATFNIVIKDPNKVITPSIIESEDNAYLYSETHTGSGNGTQWTIDRNTETENHYSRKEATSCAESNAGTMSGPYLPNGSSGGATNYLDSVEYSAQGQLLFWKFTVDVPESGEYVLRVRLMGSKTDIGQYFEVNINEQKGADDNLEYKTCTSSATTYAGNRLNEFTGATGYTTWQGMYWWSTVPLDTYQLQEGENTIRVRIVSGKVIGANIDYFQVVENDAEALQNPVIYSARDTSGKLVNLSKEGNILYLQSGKQIEDLAGVGSNSQSPNTSKLPDNYPAHLTLLYIELPDGQSLPVLKEWLSEIDYDKVGEVQTITVTAKKYGSDDVLGTATFQLMITQTGGEW